MEPETASQQNIKLAVPFFMVADMDRSLQFYREGLGFTITNKWTPRGKIEWCWLQRDAVAIMLQEPRQSNEAAEHPGKGVSICFQCDDALTLYHEFKAKGLTIQEPFVGNGQWVVSLPDPDGYYLEFESLTDVPEETKYTDWAK